MEGEVLGVALALPAEEVRRAFADAAHVCPVPGTLQRVLDVLLKKQTSYFFKTQLIGKVLKNRDEICTL